MGSRRTIPETNGKPVNPPNSRPKSQLLPPRFHRHPYKTHSLPAAALLRRPTMLRLPAPVPSIPRVPATRRSAVLRKAWGVRVRMGEVAVEGRKVVVAPSPAERMRMGRLEKDGLSYKECFIIRCYEVGMNKTATVETIANLLQEVGGSHAQSVGFSTDGFATTTTMRKLHLIWVTSRMHIEIYKYPAWSDVVEIETWCQAEGKIGTRRDWIIKDVATGDVIGRATSKWVMMNQDTRRLQRVSEEVREEYLVFCPRSPRFAFPEEDNASLKRIPKLENAQYSRLGLVPRRADLDMNQHVNNVTYIGWVLESIPQEIIDTHELQTITLDYRRECQVDDNVDSLASLEVETNLDSSSVIGSTNGSPHGSHHGKNPQFLHFLNLSASGLEINRGRTIWRKKSAK